MDDRVSIDPGRNREAPERPPRDRLKRPALALAAVIFVLMAAFAGFASYRWFEAVRQRAVAEGQRDEAATRNLATLADQALNGGDAGTAMLLALEALPDAHAGIARPYSRKPRRHCLPAVRGCRDRRAQGAR